MNSRKHTVSTLGYIMDCLHIQTVSMSRELHVDASLVSKWKSGNRKLSGKSIYFEEVVDYLLRESARTEHGLLKSALNDLCPREIPDSEQELRTLLRLTLASRQTKQQPKTEPDILASGSEQVQALVFEDNQGRREAVSRLLDYALDMNVPGEMIFIDSAEYGWLLEDPEYARQFCERVEGLLERGFHAKFVIHYSSYKERFIRLFRACSPLIFHRGVEWYYYEYYDENFFNFSFFILNRAVSMLGISSGNERSTTMIFTDTNLVLRHEMLASYVIGQCRELFVRFEPVQFGEVVDEIYHSRRRGTFYSFLPAPAFMSVNVELLEEVLRDNGIPEAGIRECARLNRRLEEVTRSYFSSESGRKDSFIHIFQLEKMLERMYMGPFYSESLTLLGGKSVRVGPGQYAGELRRLARGLNRHENLQIVLVSEKDGISLPSINCWCKQNAWMVQMDGEGFRLSDEISVVNAASITLEQCIRKVPPERKDKDSVCRYLMELADELEREGVR